MNHPDDHTAHDDTEARLRDALSTEAAMVQPGGDGLQRIREGVADGGRPWWQVPALVLGTVAVVAGVATGAYLGMRDDDGGTVVADGGTPSATAPSVTASPSATASATDASASPSPTAGGDRESTYVYFVHADPAGPRLFREQHPGVGAGDRAEQGLRRMLRGNPDDPDYATPWDSATLQSYAKSGDTVRIELSSWIDVTDELEKTAVQEIVYTVTANDPSVRTVRLSSADGKGPASAGAGVQRAPRQDVQGPIWLLAPTQGATVGSPVSIDGFGTAFEGTVSWDVRKDGRLVAEGGAQGGSNGDFADFHDTVKLDPGRYEISAYESSAENGDPTHVDTKSFTVR